MPRVSVRRLFVYAIYTVVVTSLVMLAFHVQQQNPLWLRVLEQSSGSGGYYQQNSKEIEDEAPAHFVVVNNDEKTSVDNVTTANINPLRSHGLPWYIKNDGYRPSQGDVVDNIWPDGRLNGDRIEQQLMVPTRDADGISGEGSSLLAGVVKPLKKIFLPNGLGSWQTKSGQKVFTDQKCPVDRCSLTSNREEAANADAIMFKGAEHFILSFVIYFGVFCLHSILKNREYRREQRTKTKQWSWGLLLRPVIWTR